MRLLIWLNRFQRSDASYRMDNFKVVPYNLEVNGIEPMTLCVQGRCSPS